MKLKGALNTVEQPRGSRRVVGSSGMATAIRTFDWGKTALGPLGEWSQTLVSFVNLLVCSPLPATLSWGSDLILLYNDAAISTLGMMHPGALGRGYREVFQDAWPVVGDDMESCLNQGATPARKNVMIPLLREGSMLERYWTFSLVPVYDAGRIVAVYNPFQETTEGVVDMRERESITAQLQQVLEDTSESIMTVDRNWRVTYMNPRALELSAPINAVGQNLWKSYPLLGSEGSPWLEHYHRAMNERIPSSFEAFYSDPSISGY